MSESAQKEVVEPVPAAVPMLSTHTISQLEHAAAVLLVDEPEVLLHEWLNLSAVLLAQAKQIRQRVEQLAVEWIDQNGPVQVGDIRYTAGHAKTVKCIDVSRCMALALDACHGDIDTLVLHLRSDPWKYGSVRSLLGEKTFEQLFKTQSKPKLVESKPQKQLIATNTRFVTNGRPSTDESEGE